ncbi:hypothetical protein SCALM49S_03764 [Streptomyces californicus]
MPTFSDAILVYLRDPLPVGDEHPCSPFVLRLRRSDRVSDEEGAEAVGSETERLRPLILDPQADLMPAAELCEVRPDGALAEVLRGVRPVFGDSAAARAALPELLGPGRSVPTGHRAILAPLRGRRRVIGAAVFVRGIERTAFEASDLLVAAIAGTPRSASTDVLYGAAYIADELRAPRCCRLLPSPASGSPGATCPAQRQAGRRRLVRRDPAARQPGRAGRRRRDGPFGVGGGGDGLLALGLSGVSVRSRCGGDDGGVDLRPWL